MEALDLELPTQETSKDASRLIQVLSPLVEREGNKTAEVHLSLGDERVLAEVPRQALSLFVERKRSHHRPHSC